MRKREARVLVSACTRSDSVRICIGIIARGHGVDGAVSGSSCRELCADAERRGYMGELRFSLGECSCGLPEPAGWDPFWGRLLGMIVSSWEWIKHYYPRDGSDP